MAILRIKRTNEWMNRFRAIQLIVGHKIGTIKNGEIKEFPIEAGRHSIKAVIDWCGSKEHTFEVQKNETITFKLSAFRLSTPLLLMLSISLIVQFIFSVVLKKYFISWIFLPLGLGLLYYLTIGRNEYLILTPDI